MLMKIESKDEAKSRMEQIGKRVLEDVQRVIDPNALIAGGWARDLLIKAAGVPKDIDVWFYSPLSVADIHAKLSELYPNAQRKSSLIAEPGTVAYTYARAIFKFRVDEADVDFILVPHEVSLMSIVGRFDFNICQVAYDGETFRETPAFADDKRDKRLELTDAAYERPDLGRIVHERLPKMRAKFPDWTVGDVPTVAPSPPSAGKVGFSAVYFDG